jgi:hypothetical protein
MTPRILRRTGVLAAGAMAAGLLAAPAAQAADRVDLTGGSTTLRLAPAAARALDGLGVAVAPTGAPRRARPACASRSPAARWIRDRARHDPPHGRPAPAGRHVRVTLSDFNVVVGRRSTMSARVNGGPRLGALQPVVTRARITATGCAPRCRTCRSG